MQKKGTSQIDWIVSLAIFLLFISWFFIFISPQLSVNFNQEALMVFLQNDFKNEFNWQLQNYPLFINSNSTMLNQPIFVDFTNKTNIKFMDDTNFLIWRNQLIFLANMTQNPKAYWILEGYSFNQTFIHLGLDIEEKSVSTENLSVKFDDSLLDSASYKDKEKIDNMKFKINDVNFYPESNSYTDKKFVGIYEAIYGNFNHTSMIFWGTTQIYNFITTISDSNYTLTIEMDLDNYDSYYSNNVFYGDFDYSGSKKSITYDYNYITLYGSKALTMYFDSNATYNFTSYNDTLKLKMSIPVYDGFEYRIIFHDGNYNNIEKNYYYARFGALQSLSGIFVENITTNYSHLKEKWNFPKNFQIKINLNSSAFNYLQTDKYIIGEFDPQQNKVDAITKNMKSLSTQGVYSPISVDFLIW